jgi:hypothetical protein
MVRQLLRTHKLLDGKKTDLGSLSVALLKIADQLGKTMNAGSKSMEECVRVVATLVEDVVVEVLAERIARDVRDQLSDVSACMEAASEHLKQVASMGTTSVRLLEEQCVGVKRMMEE